MDVLNGYYTKKPVLVLGTPPLPYPGKKSCGRPSRWLLVSVGLEKVKPQSVPFVGKKVKA